MSDRGYEKLELMAKLFIGFIVFIFAAAVFLAGMAFGETLPVTPVNEPIVLATTKTLPFDSGGRLVGAGATQHYGGQYAGEGTSLKSALNPGLPMIWVRGTQQRVADLGLFGDGKTDGGVGILVRKPAPGIPTGKAQIERVAFNDLFTGIQSSQLTGDANGDCMAVRDCWFESCTYGVRIVNTMGMSWRLENIHASKVDVVCDVTNGGIVHVNGVDCMDSVGTLLKLNGGHGRNNLLFSLRDVKCDGQVGEFTLIDAQIDGWARINCYDHHYSGAATAKMVLKGPKYVLFVGCGPILDGSVTAYVGRQGVPTILFIGCDLQSPTNPRRVLTTEVGNVEALGCF